MKSLVFAARNNKELIRDPLNIIFGIGFPLIVLFLLTAIQANIPNDLFKINKLTPGIAVFGLSFISLFSGTLISKDRINSFLMRLFSSPLKASDFIIGYILPLLPLAIAQSTICFIVASFLGLSINWNILLALIVLIPTSFLFIGIGLLTGTIFNDKQVGGICGALLTNLTAWFSGTWFEISLIGGAFEKIAYMLPFIHAVEATRSAVHGNYSSIMPHLWWVILYSLIIMIIATYVFNKKMKGNKS